MSAPDGNRPAASRTRDLSAIVAQSCGVITVGIGVLCLIGWVFGVEALRSISAGLKPAAPSAAVALALLGAAVFALDRWPERRAARAFANGAAVLVSVVNALLIAQFVAGVDLGLEAALSRTAETFQGLGAGRMAPLAATGLLLAALSLIALTTYPSETAAGRRVAAGMGLGTLAIGVTSLAGYVLGAPLLYGTRVVPIALPTATGLSLLGAAILATSARAARTGVTRGTGERRRRRPRLMRYVPAALGAGALALLTLVTAGIIRRLDEARLRDGFETESGTVAAALQSKIDNSLTSVRSLAATFEIDEEVTRPEFRQFATASHSTGGGVIAVAWVPNVHVAARARFEAAARRDGMRGFSFTERGPTGRLRAAGRRTEYFPVFYLEPSAGYEALLGFDAGTEPAVADALARARATGTAVVSGGFRLVTDTSGQASLVAVHPIFGAQSASPGRRGAVRGYAVGILRVDEMVRAVMSLPESRGIALTLGDLREGRSEPLYGGPQAAEAGSPLAAAETLTVADRSWQATFVPTAAYTSRLPRWSAWALLAGGLLFAFLVGAHLFGLERYTSDLEGTREKLRAITESAVDAIITIDSTGTITHCNRSALREFGYEDGGLLGVSVSVLMPPRHVAALMGLATGYVASGQAPALGEILELPAMRRDGTEFSIELTLSVWETAEGRFATAILRDITERKAAREERERLIAELQDALANVKTLRGLLPVCSWCKKVLDDRGAWRQMEAYVSEHTDADFSHGICPDCSKKYLDGDE